MFNFSIIFVHIISHNGSLLHTVPKTLIITIAGFFNPQGFLTAIRQEVTHAHKGLNLDAVILYNDVMKQMREDITFSPSEGVYVHGLLLYGAGKDRKGCKLQESHTLAYCQYLPDQ